MRRDKEDKNRNKKVEDESQKILTEVALSCIGFSADERTGAELRIADFEKDS